MHKNLKFSACMNIVHALMIYWCSSWLIAHSCFIDFVYCVDETGFVPAYSIHDCQSNCHWGQCYCARSVAVSFLMYSHWYHFKMSLCQNVQSIISLRENVAVQNVTMSAEGLWLRLFITIRLLFLYLGIHLFKRLREHHGEVSSCCCPYFLTFFLFTFIYLCVCGFYY